METKIISIRINPIELAKARDGLIAKGIKSTDLNTISKIHKLTFYYGIMEICTNPKTPPSEESIDFISNRFNEAKQNRSLTLSDV
jgi:hypothetical protein